MLSRTVLKVGALALLAACGSDACLDAPCPDSLAVVVNVNSSISGSRVPGAFAIVNGGDLDPCNQADTTVCSVFGPAGSYHIQIGAPGLTSIDTTVTFTTTVSAGCGCQTGTPVTLNLTLVPAPPPSN